MINEPDVSFQLTAPATHLSSRAKVGLAIMGIGFLSMIVALLGGAEGFPELFFWLSAGGITVGGILYAKEHFGRPPAGIQHNGVMHSQTTNRGAIGWMLGIVFTGFYVLLYFTDGILDPLVRIFDPLSYILRKEAANKWFLYGTFYTFAVLIMGMRMFYKYRHNTYQKLRTASVMFFQLGFAFILPHLLYMFNSTEFYFSYFWPLDYDLIFPNSIDYLQNQSGGIGMFMLIWGLLFTFIATPILTYFYGKRWYCSWVCGCGGLAETLGDPFRQLSDKSVNAWKFERISIYSVLGFITITTIMLWINSATEGEFLGEASQGFSSAYGLWIGSVFSGVIGTGFYPIMGNRVWCRFGCPQAAILGIIQRFFSRFRITTNGAQCISCGNCSTYCEMGIDVRSYAQRGQNIVRASCVGCGVCAAVCPRGVLSLENGPDHNDRTEYNKAFMIRNDEIDILV